LGERGRSDRKADRSGTESGAAEPAGTTKREAGRKRRQTGRPRPEPRRAEEGAREEAGASRSHKLPGVEAESAPAKDPQAGVFRWARAEARRHRARFGIGSVGVALLSIVATAAIGTHPRPTAGERLVNALIGLGIGAGLIVVLSLALALVVAPYQQRNALRRSIRVADEKGLAALDAERDRHRQTRAEVERLKAQPVEKRHRLRLLSIGAGIQKSIGAGEECEYREEDRPRTPEAYAKAMFHSHYQDLAQILESWDALVRARDAAESVLNASIDQQVSERMGTPPWNPTSICAAFATYIRLCERVYLTPLNDPGLELADVPGLKCVAWPVAVGGFDIFATDPPVHEERLRLDFIEFFERVRSSAKFDRLREIWGEVQAARPRVQEA
jgi:hypothetical protein